MLVTPWLYLLWCLRVKSQWSHSCRAGSKTWACADWGTRDGWTAHCECRHGTSNLFLQGRTHVSISQSTTSVDPWWNVRSATYLGSISHILGRHRRWCGKARWSRVSQSQSPARSWWINRRDQLQSSSGEQGERAFSADIRDARSTSSCLLMVSR